MEYTITDAIAMAGILISVGTFFGLILFSSNGKTHH